MKEIIALSILILFTILEVLYFKRFLKWLDRFLEKVQRLEDINERK